MPISLVVHSARRSYSECKFEQPPVDVDHVPIIRRQETSRVVSCDKALAFRIELIDGILVRCPDSARDRSLRRWLATNHGPHGVGSNWEKVGYVHSKITQDPK